MSHDALIEALSGYVETDEHGTVSFFNNAGAVHRTDGPAVIYSDGTETWYQHGKLHRLDGPAVIHANGSRSWFQDGLRHRTDGPAIVRADGSKVWYQNGKLHRTDGPAVVFPDGGCSWYIHGIRKTETEVRLLSQTTTAGQPPFTK